MQKIIESWTVQELRERKAQIAFPEYQREPNLWTQSDRQRLIDSMIREFDIASLYFYLRDDGIYECVDGRQRISAILSFLGDEPTSGQSRIPFKILNEIYEDDSDSYKGLEGRSFLDIMELSERQANSEAHEFVRRILEYKVAVVLLSESRGGSEFNLQFTRLNLGTIINSGEKLHAMMGEFRDVCFNDLGRHPFLNNTNIPTRRYAKEQVAAQILAQVFSTRQGQGFTRTRHFDLQRTFKQFSSLNAIQKSWIEETKCLLNHLEIGFQNTPILKNRAITVSTVMLADRVGIGTSGCAMRLSQFLDDFLARLKWQISKGLDSDEEYRHLFDFQHHMAQASAEKSSIEARAEMLFAEFRLWSSTEKLTGDEDWEKRNGGASANDVCRVKTV